MISKILKEIISELHNINDSYFFDINSIIKRITNIDPDFFDFVLIFNYNQFNGDIFFDSYFPRLDNPIERGNSFLNFNVHSSLINELNNSKIGLFRYSANSFLNGHIDESIIIIPNYHEFLYPEKPEENLLLKENISSFDYLLKPSALYIFPVYIIQSKEKRINSLNEQNNKNILHSVVVLVKRNSKSSLCLNDDKKNALKMDFKLLSMFLSTILTLIVNKRADLKLKSLIDELSNFNGINNFDQDLDRILDQFNKIFNFEGKLSVHSKLKYVSFWSLNYLNDNNLFLVKEKIAAYEKISTPNELYKDPLIITKAKVGKHKEEYHLFYSYIKSIYELGTICVKDQIQYYELKNVKSRFNNYNRFIKKYDLKGNNVLVLIPIIGHNGIAKSDETKLLGNGFVGMLAMIFHEASYNYYYSADFLEIISHKIFENIKAIIQRQRRIVRKKLYDISRSYLENEKQYYQDASRVISECINCEESFIYFNDKQNEVYQLHSMNGNINMPVRLVKSDIKSSDINNYNTFIQGLLCERKSRSPFYLKTNITIIKNNKKKKPCYSMMVMPLFNNDTVVENGEVPNGYLVLINKFRIIANNRYFSSFGPDDAEVAQICGEILLFIKQITTQQIEISNKAMKIREMSDSIYFRIESQNLVIKYISHQYRQVLALMGSPLTNIQLAYKNNILTEESFDKRIRLVLEQQRELSNLIEMYNQREDYSITKLNLFEIVESARKWTMDQLLHHGIKFEYECTDTCNLIITGNQSILRQIVLNLIENSREAIQRNKIIEGRIYINIYRNEDDLVVFKICDNGGGIPEDIFQNVFTPYFTTKANDKKHGFGLSYTRYYIQEVLKGDVYIKNINNGLELIVIFKK